MQALILAAGTGSRLAPITDSVPKCMVPVNGITMIENAIDALVAAGIRKLVIGLGYKADVLRNYIATNFDDKRLKGMTIEFAENPVYDKTNNIYSLYLAREFFERDDTILLESDLFFDKKIIKQLVATEDPNVAVVSHFEPWMDGTCTTIDEENNVTALIDKNHFKFSEVDSYYKTVNIYKFSKDFINDVYMPLLEAYQSVFGKNEYYETTLKMLIMLKPKLLKALPVSGDLWYESDDFADLNISESRFAKPSRKLKLMEQRDGGTWRFPSLTDFTNSANAFFPPKKFLEELNISVSDLVTRQPSSHFQQNLLASKLYKLLPENVAVSDSIENLMDSIECMFDDTEELSYADITYSDWTDSPVEITQKLLDDNSDTIFFKDLGQAYGIPGVKLAVLFCGNKELVQTINAFLPENNVNSIAEYCMQILEKYKKDYNQSFKSMNAEYKRLSEALSKIKGVKIQTGGMSFIAVQTKIDAKKVAEKLLDSNNMLVRVNEDKLNICVRCPKENDALIKAIKEILA